MKKYFSILFAVLVSAIVMPSCQDEVGPVYEPDKVVASTLENIGTEYVLERGGEFATLKFSATDFGMPAAVKYTAYVDIAGTNFENRKSLGNTNIDTAGIAIKADDINNALISLGCAIGTPSEVQLVVEAQMMGESSAVAGVAPVLSNVITTMVTPFDAKIEYPKIYVIGDYCGWGHGNTFYLFSYAEDKENYVGVIDFNGKAGNGFKITGEADWEHGNWGTGAATSTDPEAKSLVLIDDGGSGNITNYSQFRYYNFHFVRSSLTLNMIAGFDKVGVIGDFNGWGEDAEMTLNRADGIFYADVEIAAAGGFKFRLNSDWAVNWGGADGNLSQGGDNIAIEPGNYRIYLDLNNWSSPTYRVSADDFGKPVE